MTDGLTTTDLHDALASVVRGAYARPAAVAERLPELVDLDERFRSVALGERRYVAKRLPLAQARSERDCAAEASRLICSTIARGFGTLRVVVPDLVPIGDGSGALTSPWLGLPLSVTGSADPAAIPGEDEVQGLLSLLLGLGVDAPGCVPRNMFLHRRDLWLIDWEDAAFRAAPARPSVLSLMKWDLGWGDLLGRDLRLRERIAALESVDEPALDDFEQTLRGWLPSEFTAERIRARGVALTLASELPLANCTNAPVDGEVSPASIGHLSEDVLPPRLGVFHTVLTARVRTQCGDMGYRRLLQSLPVPTQATVGSAHRKSVVLRAGWAIGLLSGAEVLLSRGAEFSYEEVTLRNLAEEALQLSAARGWQAALRRARVAEALLARAADLVSTTLGLPELDVLLRGSCAQGVMGARSDIDFELSSTEYPRGHVAAEELIAEILEQFGFASEGSAARPKETDVRSADGSVTRDLHEWMELRRPDGDVHDPGWMAALVATSLSLLTSHTSQYEQSLGSSEGSVDVDAAAKRIWFEARSAVARLVFRSGRWLHPPVRLDRQLQLLPELVGGTEADEITALCLSAFALRESPAATASPTALRAVSDQLVALRARLALPGPPPTSSPCPPSEEHPS
jgi:hypothetical protein